MKWLTIVLALALAACNPSITGVTHGGHGAPAKVRIASPRGLFLQSGASRTVAMRRMRSASGRDIVTATGATLGEITAGGQPQTVDFTDDTGATVQVTITQAAQLTAQYILFTYNYAGGAGTDTLDMSTGALASVQVVPDNWALIYAQGSQAWYESGGGIWSCALATGACAEVSSSGFTGAHGILSTSPTPWDLNATILIDNNGTMVATDSLSGGGFQAAAISGSTQINISQYPLVYMWATNTLGSRSGTAWNLVDPSTNLMYFVMNDTIYTGTPQLATGVALDLYSVTFDLTNPQVVSSSGFGTNGGIYIARSVVTNQTYGEQNVGQTVNMAQTIFSNGPQSWLATASTIASYDTSSVPQINGVSNWIWSGGQVYAGPATAQTISLVQLAGSTGTAAPLVTDANTIESWSVVGGVLFYTDATGTYQAAVNTATATLATPTLYAGGPVQAVTQ